MNVTTSQRKVSQDEIARRATRSGNPAAAPMATAATTGGPRRPSCWPTAWAATARRNSAQSWWARVREKISGQEL